MASGGAPTSAQVMSTRGVKLRRQDPIEKCFSPSSTKPNLTANKTSVKLLFVCTTRSRVDTFSQRRLGAKNVLGPAKVQGFIYNESNHLPKQDTVEVEGEVTETLPNAQFRVQLDTGQKIIGHLSGKMRVHRIRVMPGDRVKVALSPYDLTKGRIVLRMQ